MDNTIYLMIAGQQYISKKFDMIANNVANINTPGFEKDNFLSIKQTIKMNNKYMRPMDYVDYPKDHATYRTLSKGTPMRTDRTLDIYIDSNSYFEIQDKLENKLYSRSGRFTLNSNNEIVDSKGNHLMSKDDNIIKVGNARDILIHENGDVFADQNYVSTIKAVEFYNPHKLRKQGNDYLINTLNVNHRAMDNPKTKQFYIETSNVNPIKESTDMIKEKNNFELMQNIISMEMQRRLSMISSLEKVI